MQISSVNILLAFKKSWKRLQDMSSRRLQDMSSRHLQDMSSRRLQRNNFSSSKTSSRRLARGLENVFKTSSGRLGRRKTVTLKTYWRRLQDVLKTNKCLLGHFSAIDFLICHSLSTWSTFTWNMSPCVKDRKTLMWSLNVMLIWQ